MYNPRLHFHFTGIGGSGMSGLAEILLSLGFRISGSDLRDSEVVRRLRALGAAVEIGHRAENLPESASLLVYSSAVAPSNPEYQEAVRRGLPVIRRAEVLAELMRLKFSVGVAGSHGKTTTTSLIAAVLEGGELDPTVIIGGQVRSSGTGAKAGKSDFLVAETDESDRSFLMLKPTIAVVTNIDAEHLTAYRSLSELQDSFAEFLSAVPFYGLAVLCIDDPKVRDLAQRCGKRICTFGFSPDAELRATSLRHHRLTSSYIVERLGERLCEVTLPMPGRHIVSNSLAAFAVGLEFGIPPQSIAASLSQFSGVRRRLEVVGEAGGVEVMNDYGHHPTEIRATIRAVRDGWEKNRVRVVFQPHRFTRTRDCFVEFLECFTGCDELFLTEIYAAGEDPIPGVSGRVLFDAVVHDAKRFVGDPNGAVSELLKTAEAGDVILFLGAGSVGAAAEECLRQLRVRFHGRDS